MKLKNLLNSAGAVLLMLGLNACSVLGTGTRPEAVATYISHPIQLDGKLGDPAWYKTPVYTMVHADEQFQQSPQDIQEFFRNGVAEPGKIRMLWNNKYLYFGIEFEDRDIVSESMKDQIPQFRYGDTVSIFLKPDKQTWYWEIIVTPRGCKTVYFYPSRGLIGLPACLPAKMPLKGIIAIASVKGTLNNSWDKDKKWTAEVAIPISELAMAGEKLDPKVPWRVFFGRYNYGRYLSISEKTSFPGQKQPNFHSHCEYADLKLVKGSD